MRLELKAKVDQCVMCPKQAEDASGQWYIIKEHSLYFPLGWLPWPSLQDVGMFSITKSHILCSRHGATGRHTIHVIDGN